MSLCINDSSFEGDDSDCESDAQIVTHEPEHDNMVTDVQDHAAAVDSDVRKDIIHLTRCGPVCSSVVWSALQMMCRLHDEPPKCLSNAPVKAHLKSVKHGLHVRPISSSQYCRI